jgi:biotin carboxyl carrier protein
VRFTAEVGDRRHAVEVREEKGRHVVLIDGKRLEFDVCRTGPNFLSVLFGRQSYDLDLERTPGGYTVRFHGSTIPVALEEGTAPVVVNRADSGTARVCSPMPGKVVRVLVSPGEAVELGAPLVVVEAMKMENELKASRAGHVRRVLVREGQPVEGGALLVELQ